MSSGDSPVGGAAQYDGLDAPTLADQLHLPSVVVFDLVGSTLDAAHSLAADGAAAGTLVIADAQSAGRGRFGRTWRSEPGRGVWLTLIERPPDGAALDVLSLRIGLVLAAALDLFAGERVRLKWPNDLYLGAGKLGGILIEARWRDGVPEWIGVGVGINVTPPADESAAAGLRPPVRRLDVLNVVVPAIREAVARGGALTDDELHAFAERDLAKGRWCVEPVVGRVAGIDASGALLIDVGSTRTAIRAGSLTLEEGTR